jgi:hypothetical protein
MKRRLDRSAGYLVDPKYERLSISEISFACGFSDPAHFSRTFKARFATSPKDYRKNQSRTISGTTRAHRGWPSNVRVDSGGFAPDGDNVALKAEAISAANLVALAGGHVSHFLRATPKSMHWGFFSRSIPPVIEVKSGDLVTVETLTQHASDDYERMIAGDADVEEAFLWTAEKKSIDRRGAGPMNASVLGRGAGEGFGTQIMTGPIAVRRCARSEDHRYQAAALRQSQISRAFIRQQRGDLVGLSLQGPADGSPAARKRNDLRDFRSGGSAACKADLLL